MHFPQDCEALSDYCIFTKKAQSHGQIVVTFGGRWKACRTYWALWQAPSMNAHVVISKPGQNNTTQRSSLGSSKSKKTSICCQRIQETMFYIRFGFTGQLKCRAGMILISLY